MGMSKKNRESTLPTQRPRDMSDYKYYEIDYDAVDKAIEDVAFNGKIVNKRLYHLLGWSEDKFYAICRHQPKFVEYLNTKREESLYKCHSQLEKAIKNLGIKEGNVTALIYSLKCIGVNPDAPSAITNTDSPDEDMLDLKDCTIGEIKKIDKIAQAVAKRKRKLPKTAPVNND